MKLIAKKSLRYAGRSLVAGDEFDASAKDARILKAIGKASDYVETEPEKQPEEAPKGKYKTRRLQAGE